MASSPSRGWMPIMGPRVWTFFFSRPSVDEMQSLQSPFVCPLPLPSCRLALTTSSCLCSSSPAPISVSTFRSAAREPPDPWPPSARVDRRKRSIPASPRPGHRGGGLGGEARPRCQSRRARAAGASAREWKPSGHPWKLRCEANSKRTVHQHRERKINATAPFRAAHIHSSSPPGGGGHDRQICGASAECHTSSGIANTPFPLFPCFLFLLFPPITPRRRLLTVHLHLRHSQQRPSPTCLLPQAFEQKSGGSPPPHCAMNPSSPHGRWVRPLSPRGARRSTAHRAAGGGGGEDGDW